MRARSRPHRPPEGLPPSDPDALREAIDEACGPAHRGEAADDPGRRRDPPLRPPGGAARHWPSQTGMPIATTILGKSVISEAHPLFAGIYEGAMGRRRGHRAGRVGRLPAHARLLPHRHQPGHLHRQARPVAVHRRDQRGPADPSSSLPRRPPRRLPPRPHRPAARLLNRTPLPGKAESVCRGRGNGRRRTRRSSLHLSSAGSTGCWPSIPT